MQEDKRKMRTEFLSGMSHEIRTPLNVIIGMCDIAMYHIDDKKRVLECLQRISTAGDHLTQLINNILDITKLEQGKMPIKEEAFHLDQLTDELYALLEPLASEKMIIFEMSSKKVINKQVTGDYGRIMQIMINLLTNAIKYTPQGGFVRFWVEEKENTCPNKVTYSFVCEDNGIGMPETFLEHIFKPFSRADDVKVSQIEGAGLGMSIVKEIIDAMGGTIHIDSILNGGTTVTVDLELKTTAGEKCVSDIEAFRRQMQKRIREKKIVLVAEDLKDHEAVLAAFFEDLGFEAICAANGEDVVDWFMESEEGYYKAIFMDIEMPILDGYQASLMIRGLNRSDSNIPIIAMTANAFDADKEKAKQAGMSDYLTKPLKMEQLGEMVNKWIKEKDD